MAVWADTEEEDDPYEERPTVSSRIVTVNIVHEVLSGNAKDGCDPVIYISQALRCYPYAFR